MINSIELDIRVRISWDTDSSNYFGIVKGFSYKKYLILFNDDNSGNKIQHHVNTQFISSVDYIEELLYF